MSKDIIDKIRDYYRKIINLKKYYTDLYTSGKSINNIDIKLLMNFNDDDILMMCFDYYYDLINTYNNIYVLLDNIIDDKTDDKYKRYVNIEKRIHEYKSVPIFKKDEFENENIIIYLNDNLTFEEIQKGFIRDKILFTEDIALSNVLKYTKKHIIK